METVTFEDMLLHYERKLTEVTEELGDIKTLIKEALALLEESWQGAAASSYGEKLLTSLSDVQKADNDLNEALIKLSGVFGVVTETAEQDLV